MQVGAFLLASAVRMCKAAKRMLGEKPEGEAHMRDVSSAKLARSCAILFVILVTALGLYGCGGGGAGESTAKVNANTSSPAGDNSAILEWDAVAAANLAGYRVYYGTAPGKYVQSAGGGVLVLGNVTTYTVTGLSRGTRYYFAVTAFDTSNDESVYSNEVFKDIP